MPELPEVETVRAYIAEHAVGKRIENVRLLLPRLVKTRCLRNFAAD